MCAPLHFFTEISIQILGCVKVVKQKQKKNSMHVWKWNVKNLMKIVCQNKICDWLQKKNCDEDFDCTIPEPDIKISCYSMSPLNV